MLTGSLRVLVTTFRIDNMKGAATSLVTTLASFLLSSCEQK